MSGLRVNQALAFESVSRSARPNYIFAEREKYGIEHPLIANRVARSLDNDGFPDKLPRRRRIVILLPALANTKVRSVPAVTSDVCVNVCPLSEKGCGSP